MGELLKFPNPPVEEPLVIEYVVPSDGTPPPGLTPASEEGSIRVIYTHEWRTDASEQ